MGRTLEAMTLLLIPGRVETPMTTPQPSGPDRPSRGLVLSGGGALGAYQAGALVALKDRGVEFDLMAATSIGVLHALVWNRGEEMIRDLENTWVDTVEWVQPFVLGRLARLQNPFAYGDALDRIFGRYRDSQPAATEEGQVPIIVFLTDAGTHRSVSFNTATDGFDRDERELIYRASAAIPALGDRAIEVRGKRYYDGGFTNNLPLDALLKEDLDEVWAITPFRKRKSAQGVKAVSRAAKSVWKRARGRGSHDQASSQGATVRSSSRLVVIRPAADDTSREFRTYHAVLFSTANIRRLFRRGYADGEAAWERYRGQ